MAQERTKRCGGPGQDQANEHCRNSPPRPARTTSEKPIRRNHVDPLLSSGFSSCNFCGSWQADYGIPRRGGRPCGAWTARSSWTGAWHGKREEEGGASRMSNLSKNGSSTYAGRGVAAVLAPLDHQPYRLCQPEATAIPATSPVDQKIAAKELVALAGRRTQGQPQPSGNARFVADCMPRAHLRGA